MQDIRERLARLLNAIKTESGLIKVETCMKEVIGAQFANNQTAKSVAESKASTGKGMENPKIKSVSLDLGNDWESALEQCDSILESLSDLPEAAEEFSDSVGNKVESIREWIEDHKDVTNAQLTALENMESGVARWQR